MNYKKINGGHVGDERRIWETHGDSTMYNKNIYNNDESSLIKNIKSFFTIHNIIILLIIFSIIVVIIYNIYENYENYKMKNNKNVNTKKK